MAEPAVSSREKPGGEVNARIGLGAVEVEVERYVQFVSVILSIFLTLFAFRFRFVENLCSIKRCLAMKLW